MGGCMGLVWKGDCVGGDTTRGVGPQGIQQKTRNEGGERDLWQRKKGNTKKTLRYNLILSSQVQKRKNDVLTLW